MPYATQADLLQRMTLAQLTQLTDDTKQGQPDATIVANALEEASGRVDAYCRGRYVTPLQASDTATTITRDIAVYMLYGRRPQTVSEAVKDRYAEAMQMLKDIASGKAVLDQPATAAAPQSTSAGPVLPLCNPCRPTLRMTDCDLEGFV